MDELDNLAPQPAAQPQPAKPRRRFGRGRALLFLGFAALAVAIAGGVATRAFSHGWGMMHMGHHGDMSDPAAMGEHIERMVAHLAIEVDATPEQESKLAEIAKAAATDLLPLREQWQGAHDDAIALLTGSTVDRAAIEQFRTAHLQLADTATRRLAAALADAAEVLTVEQRQALAERIAQFHDRRHD